MRTPLIAGNAKMNLDRSSLARLLETLRDALREQPPACEVAYCPPSVFLAKSQGILDQSAVALGAQNMHWESGGAFTGEISASMLREAGCRFVILGHSERRTWFAETDAQVAKKTLAAFAAGLVPIVCVGESESEREAGETKRVLSAQISGSLAGVAVEDPDRLVIAYEPVWAIGTGKNATPDQAQEAHAHLRRELESLLGGTAAGIRILYGGSVKPDNAAGLLAGEDIDGALVGGASLDPESFLGIIRAAGKAVG